MGNIYCHGEAKNFPETEFLRDKDGKLYVPFIHARGNPHYATGEPLDPLPIPGVPLRVRDLAARLHSVALKMKEDDLKQVIDDIEKKTK
jgi:hypothetical protein